MNMTFRWYGKDNDSVSLKEVKQIPGVKGIVWALHKKGVGEIWNRDEVESYTYYIQSYGFHTDVVESVNVHESIKLGLPDRSVFIENYKKTIENLANVGVKVICYNFMPIFDWTRTDLYHPMQDGSTALFYNHEIINSMNPDELVKRVTTSSDLTLPGWEPEKINRIKELFKKYENISEEDMWANLGYFLSEILPVAEKHNIKMAIHPDDPPWKIFGLPKIIINEESIKRLLKISDSPSNCITFCTGSLGANSNNDMVKLSAKYAKHSPFFHIRNIKKYDNGSFIETSHYTQDGSIEIDGVVKELAKQDYAGYIRPDHGRHIWNEEPRPGYGLYDRGLGIMYLLGLWDAFKYV